MNCLPIRPIGEGVTFCQLMSVDGFLGQLFVDLSYIVR